MIRKLLTFVLPIALAACASGPQEVTPAATGAAATAGAERPDIKVGDKWVFACTYGFMKGDAVTVVTSVDQAGIKATTNGEPVVMTPELNVLESPEQTSSDPRRLSFPLEVGKHWSVKQTYVWHEPNAKGSEKLDVSVVGYEKVHVRAGEFDAFKLKWTSQWANDQHNSGTTDYTYWYAPAARYLVKSELSRHWEPDRNCELVEYQLQP
ncbi:MAG TPA: hypothetical protein VEI05_01555 [Burkholderiaceae bacterium]|nr:hypothetical protein [Burkholderiaceae bacterium]